MIRSELNGAFYVSYSSYSYVCVNETTQQDSSISINDLTFAQHPTSF
jgi:hypothetical protein